MLATDLYFIGDVSSENSLTEELLFGDAEVDCVVVEVLEYATYEYYIFYLKYFH